MNKLLLLFATVLSLSAHANYELEDNPVSDSEFRDEVTQMMIEEGMTDATDKVIHLKDGSVAKQILTKGDVIDEVNGKKILSPKEAMVLSTEIEKPGKHMIKIKRQGKEETMHIQVIQ